jgi:hypothetical protein
MSPKDLRKELRHKMALLEYSVAAATNTTPGRIRDLFLHQATRLEQEIAHISSQLPARSPRLPKRGAASRITRFRNRLTRQSKRRH